MFKITLISNFFSLRSFSVYEKVELIFKVLYTIATEK